MAKDHLYKESSRPHSPKNQGLGAHNQPRGQKALPKTAIACMVAACFAADVAVANPLNPSVINGAVSFNVTGNTLTVTNSPSAIINWQGFSIGVGEITRFIQQSAASAVLNRVTGVDPSVILGSLQSNGRVFLINPNGIVFGAGSQINVGGLVASSLNLSNQDFLAGRLNFTATSGAGNLTNQGSISAGSVYLIAPNVENSGIITSPNGEVILAAGKSVELVNPGTPNLRVEITADNNQAKNLGQIVADSGSIGIYAGLINNSGILSADSAVAQGGRIILQATQTTNAGGTITATGTQGGSVQLLGDTVNVAVGATVDVSGTNGGGTILVGGDEHGANPDVQNASFTTIGSGANLIADATENGNGGKVIVWSDNTTYFNGHISAQGGVDGGNGGFAEVSGKQHLAMLGYADLRAENGAFGTLLLDPGTVTIDGAEGNNFDHFSTGYISTQLGGGSLTITTGTGVSGPQDINFNSGSVAWASGTTFTLSAGNNINFAGSVAATNGYVNFSAGNALALTGTINLTNGTATLQSGLGNITQSGGSITSAGLELISNHDVSLTGANNVNALSASVGTLVFNDVGPLTIDYVGGTDGVTAFNGMANITAGGLLTVNRQIRVYSNGSNGESVSATLSGNGILIDGAEGGYIDVYGANNNNAGSGGNATLTLNGGAGGITVTTSGYYGYVEVNGGDGYSNGVTNGGNGNMTVNAGAGGITLNHSSLSAYGGEAYNGGTGGAANIQLNSSGAFTSNYSSITAEGGYGSSANGGAAYIGVVASVINIVNSDGGEGALLAEGGEGYYGNGGNAGMLLNTAGTVSLTNSSIEVQGGDSEYNNSNGGDATLGIVAGGSISVVGDGGEGQAILSKGGESYGSSGNGGNGILGLFSTAGNIMIDGGGVYSTVAAQGGESSDGSGAPGNAVATVSTGGQIIIQNEGAVGAIGGGIDGGEGYGTGVLTLLGLSGITLDHGAAIAVGGSASAYLTTNGSLNVLNGSYVYSDGYDNLNGTPGTGLVLVDTGQDVNVTGSQSGYGYSELYGTSEVDMTVGGIVHLTAGGGGGENGATIMAGSPNTIFINFRNLTSQDGGGYFVNGNEGVIWDDATQTGFFIDGAPAILGQNLFITYSGTTTLPPQIISALNTIVDQTNKILPDDKNNNNSNNNDDKNNKSDKDKPTCS